MFAFDYVMLLIAAAIVAFQIWLTVRVFRSGLYERKQKILQAQLIWLLPILGASLVFHVMREDRSYERGTSQLER